MSLLPGLDTRLEAGSVIPPRQGHQEQVPFAAPPCLSAAFECVFVHMAHA